MEAGGVLKPADDLARVVDAECLGGAGNGRGIVKRVEDMDWHDTGSSVMVSVADKASIRGLSRVQIARPALHTASDTRVGAQGIVEGGVGAAAIEKAMNAAGVLVVADDLA